MGVTTLIIARLDKSDKNENPTQIYLPTSPIPAMDSQILFLPGCIASSPPLSGEPSPPDTDGQHLCARPPREDWHALTYINISWPPN